MTKNSPFIDETFREIPSWNRRPSELRISSSLLGLKEAISATFEDTEVENWKGKLVAFGADGASVNLGKKAGLAALLKKEVPHLVEFHCLPHRLELALLELQNSCKSVEDAYSVLHLIWKTYNYSPKIVRALKSIADELETNILRPTQVRGTCWLLHVSRALKVFVGHNSASVSGQYAVMLMHMEDLCQLQKCWHSGTSVARVCKDTRIYFCWCNGSCKASEKSESGRWEWGEIVQKGGGLQTSSETKESPLNMNN